MHEPGFYQSEREGSRRAIAMLVICALLCCLLGLSQVLMLMVG